MLLHTKSYLCDSHLFLDNNQSKWIKLLGSGLVPSTHHLKNAENGAEFACVHNRDANDFMNEDKFERFILRKTKCSEPFEWDLLDETGTSIVHHIVEDDDQGPSIHLVKLILRVKAKLCSYHLKLEFNS